MVDMVTDHEIAAAWDAGDITWVDDIPVWNYREGAPMARITPDDKVAANASARKVVRTYNVPLWPDSTPDGPYEPFTVTVSYTAAKAAALDPMSPEAIAEVLARAERIERALHPTSPGTTFADGGITLVSERVSARRITR